MLAWSEYPAVTIQPNFPLTYFMYSARSVARMACFIIFSVALYSSMERLLRIWFPFTKKAKNSAISKMGNSTPVCSSKVTKSLWVACWYLRSFFYPASFCRFPSLKIKIPVFLSNGRKPRSGNIISDYYKMKLQAEQHQSLQVHFIH